MINRVMEKQNVVEIGKKGQTTYEMREIEKRTVKLITTVLNVDLALKSMCVLSVSPILNILAQQTSTKTSKDDLQSRY